MSLCVGDVCVQLVTASADGTARVYNSTTGACQAILVGHAGEISKVGGHVARLVVRRLTCGGSVCTMCCIVVALTMVLTGVL